MHAQFTLAITALWPGFTVDATEMAPPMRGDVEVRYQFAQERAGLVEDQTDVGKRITSTHHVDTWLTFNPIKGAGVFIHLPATPSTEISYLEAYQMGFDPGNDSGTLLEKSALDNPPTLQGKGLEGTWIGLRGSPLHEELYADRGDRVSWVLDLGYRFKDKSHFYALDEDGQRGAGPGASAWLMRGAFSTTHNNTQPYLVATWIATGLLTDDVVDQDGTVMSTDAAIRPASTVTFATGAAVEAHTWGQGANSGRLLIDPHLSFGYQSWQDVPSGTYLPDVLEASQALLATQSEHLFLSAGLSFDIRIMEYIELDIGADAGVRTAHRVEHFYPVSTTLGSLTWQTHAALRFRARDPLMADVLPAPIGPL